MVVRVAVTGATGNVGTSVLAALCDDPAVEEIVGVARRRPPQSVEKVRWVSADVATDDLSPAVRWRSDRYLLPGKGLCRAHSRRLRVAQPNDTGRPSAAGFRVQTGCGERDPAVVRWTSRTESAAPS